MSKRLLNIILLISFNFSAYADNPSQVYIEGDEIGQGFSVKRLNLCYFIAPLHVINDSYFLTVKGSDNLRSLGEGQPLQPFGYDLSVGHISGSLANHCGIEINRLSVDQSDIDKAKTIVVSTVNSDGLVSRTPAVVQETGLVYLSIKPLSSDKSFFKGMSGSLVYSQGAPIGMLQSVDSASGFGKVLRMDRLLETVSPFFTSSGNQKPEPESNLQIKDTASKSDQLNYEISHWSSPPTNSHQSIKRVSDGSIETYYETNLNGRAAEIDLSLLGFKNIDYLTISLPENSGIKDIEILTSKKKSGKRGWISSASGTILPKDNQFRVTLHNVKAQRIKLKMYSSWNNEGLIRISEINIFKTD
ncbi:hypothetical protein [Psychrosphaera aestuarii]|uniref:hypothetical protein n=1 Tax=Psychrosphaera aestuarii TaxID=1266052 RepID=UPI001B3256EC|nr:hypothetical protein [Psychrosphaera aestuarii]